MLRMGERTSVLMLLLYIKRKTSLPVQFASDFTDQTEWEGAKRDAENVILNGLDEIWRITQKRRDKMGSKLTRMPNDVWYIVYLQTNNGIIKKRDHLDLRQML